MIQYEKGKGITKRTGMDQVQHVAGKVVKAIPNALARHRKGKALKEIDDISRGFGSLENYERLYPETKKRNDALRNSAY